MTTEKMVEKTAAAEHGSGVVGEAAGRGNCWGKQNQSRRRRWVTAGRKEATPGRGRMYIDQIHGGVCGWVFGAVPGRPW